MNKKLLLKKSPNKTKSIHLGIPQGTILGPMFFLFYVYFLNDRLMKYYILC